MNIETAIHQFVLAVSASRSANTARAYEQSVRVFSIFLAEHAVTGSSPTESLNAGLFIEFPAWIASYKYDGKARFSKQTLNVYVSGVKALLDHFVIAGYVLPTYQDGVRLERAYREIYKKRDTRLPRWPKKDDVAKMVEAVRAVNQPSPRKERDVALVEFLSSSGCRISEATNLSVSDVDLTNRSAIVTGKGSKQRVVFFGPEAKQAFQAYWRAAHIASPTDPAFCRHDKGAGKKIHKRMTSTTGRAIVKEVAEVAGIDPSLFTPHYFRHDFAIKVLRKTGNLALVQDLMGHASPASTRVYAKIYPDELQKAHRDLYG